MPAMRFNHDTYSQKLYPSTTTFDTPPPSSSPNKRPEKWHKHLGSRFDILSLRSTHPATGSNLRSSLSSPSSLGTAVRSWGKSRGPPPPLPPLPPRLQAPHRPPRSPYVIQEAANNVVGVHPNPSSIIPSLVFTPLASPNLGRGFHFDCTWVTQDMSFGLAIPGSQSSASPGGPNASPHRNLHWPRDASTQHRRDEAAAPTPRILNDITNIKLRTSDRPPPPPLLLADNGKYPRHIPAPIQRTTSRARALSQSKNVRENTGAKGNEKKAKGPMISASSRKENAGQGAPPRRSNNAF